MTKKLTATALGLPSLRDIKQTVGKDNHAMIAILVAHNKELVRQQARAGNWGWVISDTGIASKTSKGILSTGAEGCKWDSREATAQDIRDHFADRGCIVRISRDGHVTFRYDREPGWREGRYVSEYRIIEGEVVHT